MPKEPYRREFPQFSLCGLSCALCTMHLGGYCPGCGGGPGNQPCRFTRCARERGGLEFCWLCGEYPCEKYRGAAEYDSFLSHQAMFRDAARAGEIGVKAYLEELEQREAVLRSLLDGFNDGRRKTLFCTAAALLSLPALRRVLEQLSLEQPALGQPAPEQPATPEAPRSVKERAALAAGLLLAAAEEEGVSLKLRKRPKK